MRRREAIGLASGALVVTLGWSAIQPGSEDVEIRYWSSTRAAEYDIRDRIVEYVTAAFEPVFDDLVVSYGGVVSVRTEHGYHVTRRGEWPRRLLVDALETESDRRTADVNLLVTDGPMSEAPTGVAIPHVASVGGARYLEEVPPRDELQHIVRYSRGLWVMQVMLHEIGHAFGLEHEHGKIMSKQDGTAVTPMVSSYAWMSDPEAFDAGESHCGFVYPTARGGTMYLSFRFSECSLAELRTYRGVLRPRRRSA